MLYPANSPIPVPAQSSVAVVVTVAPTVISAPIGADGADVTLHTLSATGEHVIATSSAETITADQPVYCFPGNFSSAAAGSAAGGGTSVTVDQTYSATSPNPQSGTAVAQAVASAAGDCNVTITDRGSIVCGEGATVNGAGGSIALGYHSAVREVNNNNYTSTSSNTASTSVAYGANAAASVRSVAIGGLAQAGSVSSTSYSQNTAIGFCAKAGTSNSGGTASGSYATASGSYATASGYSATASGDSATASGYYATASGASATASGYYATASGTASTASGSYATASGYSATASGASATASGTESTASGASATASGYSATASGDSATASGASATASGSSATASGYYATASGFYSSAIAAEAVASGYASAAIGGKCQNPQDGCTACLIGFDPPSDENNGHGYQYQLFFFLKDGAPHIGFVKGHIGGSSCGLGELEIDESYAVDLSLLPHVEWQPEATHYDSEGNLIS